MVKSIFGKTEKTENFGNREFILGVKVDNLIKQEILLKLNVFLDDPRFRQIATINPEFVLEAQKNREYKKILNACDLNVADGVGIWLAFLRFGSYLKAKITGVRVTSYILKKAEQKKLSVFLACKKDGLSSFWEIKKAIARKYPKLEIKGADLNSGSTSSKILGVNQEILLCNFGTPAQELFIKSQKNDKIRLAVGVGGTFDFWTGKAKRAPVAMRKIGLEWAWRLVQQPKRMKRIYRSVVVFPLKIIFNKKTR